MQIELKDGRWVVNGKEFKDLTPQEVEILNLFFQQLKAERNEH